MRAQSLYGLTIHAFVFISTHSNFLLSPSSAMFASQFAMEPIPVIGDDG